MNQKKFVGNWAEAQAARFLLAKNWKLLGQNVQLGQLEIDLIMQDVKQNELVFVEVKFRTSSDFGGAELSINRRKLLAMRRAAGKYCREFGISRPWRIDFVAITGHHLSHFPNITWEMVK